MSSIIVRPSSISTAAPDVSMFFEPNWTESLLSERYPDDPRPSTTAGFVPTWVIAPCCSGFGTCGFEEDPPLRTFLVRRFCSPWMGLLADEQTFDGETGSYWCIRSSKYYLRVQADLYRGWGETSACTGNEGQGNYLCGIKFTLWLLDQNFDTEGLTWNTKDSVPLTGIKLVCNLQAEVGYQNGFVELDQNYLIELPNLADGSGPPRIYGYHAEVEQYPKTIFQNESGHVHVELWAHKESDRRYADAESGYLLPPDDRYPFAPDDDGYMGEWEAGPYKPPIPYAFWNLQYVDVPKDTTYGPLPFDVTDANQVDSTLTIVKTSGPSHGTTSGSSWAMTYTPTPGWTGYDTIYYKAMNSAGRYSNEARILFHVQ